MSEYQNIVSSQEISVQEIPLVQDQGIIVEEYNSLIPHNSQEDDKSIKGSFSLEDDDANDIDIISKNEWDGKINNYDWCQIEETSIEDMDDNGPFQINNHILIKYTGPPTTFQFFIPRGIPFLLHPSHFIITKEESLTLTDTILGNKVENCITAVLEYYSKAYTFSIQQNNGSSSWKIDSKPLFEPYPKFDPDNNDLFHYIQLTIHLYVNASIRIYKIRELDQYCIEYHRYHSGFCPVYETLTYNLYSMFSIDDNKYDIKWTPDDYDDKDYNIKL